jgi:hypothetical protein
VRKTKYEDRVLSITALQGKRKVRA